jgi:hypothetical protein
MEEKMKKTVLWLLVLTMIVSLALTGCGKDKKSTNNTITGSDLADLENGDFDFFLGITSFDIYDKGTYLVMIQSYDYEQQITSATLSINNQEVPLSQEGYDGYYFFYGEVMLNQGQAAAYDVTVNSASYSGELTIPYQPQNVNFPMEFNPAQSYDISWSLGGNSQYQLFEVYGYNWDDDEEDGEYKELSPSARSFTIPANWVNSGFEYYDIALSEFSANWSGKFIAVAFDGSIAEYGYEEWKTNQQKMRERILTLTKVIQK